MSYSTIKFGNNLIKNKTCTITYSGMLFQNNSEFVNIVYGFGNEWHHTKEQEMERTEDGFVVEVNMLDYDTFNFCFRNSNYEWDNNNYQNYTSPITEEVIEDINFIINDESVINNIMDNLCEIDISTLPDVKAVQTIEAIEESAPITTEESAPFEIEVEPNIPVNIEESLVNTVEVETLDQDIENLFTDIYQEATSEVVTGEEVQQAKEDSFDMNNLINEILSPVVKSTIFEEENLENYSADIASENEPSFFNDFEDLEEDSNLDSKIDNLITDLFNNTKAFAEEQNSNFENVNEAEIDKAIDNRIEEILAETPVIEEVKIEEAKIEEEKVSPVVVKATVTKKVPDFTIIEDEEESLINTINEENVEEKAEESTNNNSTALIEVETENGFSVSPRSLRKFYMFKKKIKLAFTKLFVTLPKLFGKGFNTENN